MALDDALKSFAAARADDINAFAVSENRHQHLIAWLRGVASRRHFHLASYACRRHVRLLEMSDGRFVALRRAVFDESELHGLVAVCLRVFRLDDDAGASLDHRRGMNSAIRVED